MSVSRYFYLGSVWSVVTAAVAFELSLGQGLAVVSFWTCAMGAVLSRLDGE